MRSIWESDNPDSDMMEKFYENRLNGLMTEEPDKNEVEEALSVLEKTWAADKRDEQEKKRENGGSAV